AHLPRHRHRCRARARAPAPRRPRRPDLPPVGRLLRRQRADVLPRARVPRRGPRRVPRRDRGHAVLHGRRAVRVLAAHAPHPRRGARAGERLLARGARGGAVPHPLAALQRRGVRGARGRGGGARRRAAAGV
ncbi:MAG: FIG00450153: hypothetical protein, partial [uncultured Gemmatimonadaceae bacterium]